MSGIYFNKTTRRPPLKWIVLLLKTLSSSKKNCPLFKFGKREKYIYRFQEILYSKCAIVFFNKVGLCKGMVLKNV